VANPSDGLTVAEQDQLAAIKMVQHIRDGNYPPEINSTILLRRDESEFASFPASTYGYTGAEVMVPGSAWLAFGSPLFMIGTLAGSAAFNSARKRKAARQAAPQWRLDNQGSLHVTSERLALQGIHGWVDLWYEHFRAVEVTQIGLVFHYADWPMMRLDCAAPVWTWMMVHYLGFDRLVDIPVSESFVARVTYYGRHWVTVKVLLSPENSVVASRTRQCNQEQGARAAC